MMEPKDRLAQIMSLQAGLAAAWSTLEAHLESRRSELVENLVTGSDAIGDQLTRGRIKELTELLGLPERLQQEAQSLTAPQQEAELP